MSKQFQKKRVREEAISEKIMTDNFLEIIKHMTLRIRKHNE